MKGKVREERNWGLGKKECRINEERRVGEGEMEGLGGNIGEGIREG